MTRQCIWQEMVIMYHTASQHVRALYLSHAIIYIYIYITCSQRNVLDMSSVYKCQPSKLGQLPQSVGRSL